MPFLLDKRSGRLGPKICPPLPIPCVLSKGMASCPPQAAARGGWRGRPAAAAAAPPPPPWQQPWTAGITPTVRGRLLGIRGCDVTAGEPVHGPWPIHWASTRDARGLHRHQSHRTLRGDRLGRASGGVRGTRGSRSAPRHACAQAGCPGSECTGGGGGAKRRGEGCVGLSTNLVTGSAIDARPQTRPRRRGESAA
eukprot:366328-Chlamydomonas_euryale.AAC.19